MSEPFEVVAVLKAAGYGEQARPDHVGVVVDRARGIAGVGYAAGKQFDDPEPPLDPGKQQNAAIRRQPPAVELGTQFLASNGRQTGQIGDRLVHGEP